MSIEHHKLHHKSSTPTSSTIHEPSSLSTILSKTPLFNNHPIPVPTIDSSPGTAGPSSALPTTIVKSQAAINYTKRRDRARIVHIGEDTYNSM